MAMNENENYASDIAPTQMDPAGVDTAQADTVTPLPEAEAASQHQYIPTNPVVPEAGDDSSEKKKKNPLPFILIPVGVILLGLAIFFGIRFIKSKILSDKERVILAYAKTFGDQSLFAVMGGYEDEAGNGNLLPAYVDDFVNAENTVKNIMENGAETSLNIKLKDYTIGGAYGSYIPSISGVSASFEGQYAPKSGAVYQQFKLNYVGFKLFEMQTRMTDSSISVALPDMNDAYYTIDTIHLGTKYNEWIQALADEAGEDADDLLIPDALADTVSLNPLKFSEMPDLSFTAYIKNPASREALLAFYNSIEVTKEEDKKGMTVGGDVLQCDVFQTTITKDSICALTDAYNTWCVNTMEAYLKENEGLAAIAYYAATNDDSEVDYVAELVKLYDEEHQKATQAFKDTFADDIAFESIIDKDNRLIASSTTISIVDDQNETWDMSLSLSFSGAQYLCDNMECTFTANGATSGKYEFFVKNNGETNNNIRKDTTFMSVSERGNTAFEVTSNSEYVFEDKHFHCSTEIKNCYSSVLYNTEVDGDLSITDTAISTDIDTLKFTLTSDYDEYMIDLGIDATVKALEGDVKELSGTEHKLFEMDMEALEELSSDFSDFFLNKLLQYIY